MEQEKKDRLQYMIDVMQAYKDGKEIELKSVGSAAWTLAEWEPSWNWLDNDFRVKPEPPKPQYRPFENMQEVMEAIKEHGDIVLGKCSTVYRKIIAFNPCDVYFGAAKFIGYKDAYETYIFADGTPFGKLIEE